MSADSSTEGPSEDGNLEHMDEFKASSPPTDGDADSTRASSRNDSFRPGEVAPPPQSKFVQMELVPFGMLTLNGWCLELLIAPGDIFVVPGTGRLAAIGTAGGFMGHVILALQRPQGVTRGSPESHDLEEIWPAENVKELWKVHTIESTRTGNGLTETECLFFVDPKTLRLTFCGEITREGELNAAEHEEVEIWQSPNELRDLLFPDLMWECVKEMHDHEADWSEMTAMRAVFKSARISKNEGPESLPKIQKYWTAKPICTSVAIVFWQRYFCKLVERRPESRPVVTWNGVPDSSPAEQQWNLILTWMPLKADRVLPGDLTSLLREVGWGCLTTVPRIFRPMQMAQWPRAIQEGALQLPEGDAEPAERIDATQEDTQKMLSSQGAESDSVFAESDSVCDSLFAETDSICERHRPPEFHGPEIASSSKDHI